MGLRLADDRFPMVAGDVVEPHAVVVEVVEDGDTELIALSVIRLGATGPGESSLKSMLAQL